MRISQAEMRKPTHWRRRGLRVASGLGIVFFATASWALLFATPLAAEPPLVPVVDLHVDLAYRSLYKKRPFAEGSGQFAASKLLRAGVRGVVLPLYVPLDAPAGRSRSELERSYAHVFRSMLKTPPYALPGCGVDRAGSEPRPLATWLAFEGAAAVGADEEALRKWSLRGVRSFGLVHTQRNRLTGSSGPGPYENKKAPGLSDEGRRFVDLVHQVGGLVDVSHASDAATNEAIAIAKRSGHAIIATHSNARALAPHPRNLTDDQIRGVAQTGGVIGVNFHQPYLASQVGGRANVQDLVRQIRHIESIGGIDAVAIGSDFEGGIQSVPELSDAGAFQRLAAFLRQDGMNEAQLAKVFSGNALRVLCPSQK